jgi:Spy/CpxP family protein refolding chaperone
VLNDINFEGIIPAGTAVAQVIPFQREDWQMSIGKNEEIMETSKITTKLRTRFFDSYKTQYRQTKEYR